MAQGRAVGIYGQPGWSTDCVRDAVRTVGWQQICLCELDDLSTIRAHFFRVYEAYRARVVHDRVVGRLPDGRTPFSLGDGESSGRDCA